MASKLFHLGDVLSITTGKLMSNRHMDGIYEILNFMTGDNLFTHQLSGAMDECRPYLLQQHPQLVDVVIEGVMGENFHQKLEALCAEYGQEFLVESLPADAREQIDPISELAEKVHPSKIVVINPDN